MEDNLSRIFCALLLTVLLGGSACVSVHKVQLLSTLRPSYALHGEPATLSCEYEISPSERVTEVEWEKDGTLVYVWSLGEPSQAFDVLEEAVDLANSSSGQLVIRRADMRMQGTYNCRVRTNGRTSENDMYLMVIVDACKDSNWKTHSDMVNCVETVNFHCIGVYPKPSPQCGVFSQGTGKFLHSIPFDSTSKLPNGTFEVSINRRFSARDWLNHTDIYFQCYVIMENTPWRNGIKHKMFGEAGCKSDPPSIAHGYYNVTEASRSCWEWWAEGSNVTYTCEDGFRMRGSNAYLCERGRWRKAGLAVHDAMPLCSDKNRGSFKSVNWILVLTTIFFYLTRTNIP